MKRLAAAVLIAGGMLVSLVAVSQAATVYVSVNTQQAPTGWQLEAFDTVTGVSTAVGSIPEYMGSLAISASGDLYGVSQGAPCCFLYSIDTNTGASSAIGDLSDTQNFESLTFDLDGRLIAASSTGGYIYEVSTADASTKLLGIAGISFDGMSVAPTALDVQGIGVVAAGTYFAVDTGRLYAIDPDSFAAILIAELGAEIANQSVSFLADGTLLGFGQLGVHRIDLLTLAATNIGSVSRVAGSATQINPVPIPAALPLLLSALGFFGFMGWRRKRMAAAWTVRTRDCSD